MLKHWRQRSEARRVATLVLSIGTLLCSFSAAADGWTGSAPVGNIQSSSTGTPSDGNMVHFFTSAGGPWNVSGGNGICSSPTFVYIQSSQFGYRELLANVMLAKTLGKTVYFQGDCTHADYFKAHYVIMNN